MQDYKQKFSKEFWEKELKGRRGVEIRKEYPCSHGWVIKDNHSTILVYNRKLEQYQTFTLVNEYDGEQCGSKNPVHCRHYKNEQDQTILLVDF